MLMRFLARWIDRGWIRCLHLLTESNQQALVKSELGTERIKITDYGWREGLASAQMFCCVGDRETIVVQGEMLPVPATTARVTSYSATLGPNDRMLGSEGVAGSLIENMQAMLRLQKRKADAAVKKKTAKKKEGKPKAVEELPKTDDK